jgi:endonuclease YncB( thermonuclease family)
VERRPSSAPRTVRLSGACVSPDSPIMKGVAGPGRVTARSEARADADPSSPKAGSSPLLRSLRSVLGRLAALWLAFALPHAALAAPPRAADRDCADFDNQAKAQRYFIDRGGADSDHDRLDGDGDGVACDSLPCPCNSGRSPSPTPSPEEKPRRKAQTIRGRVTDVIDGDTIRVRPLEETRRSSYTVRLIGIDTPETKRPGTPVECGGPEASANLERIAEGRRVRLRTDPSQDTFDRYDRLLAYAELRGGPDAAIAQLRAGWAQVYVYGGKRFKRVRAFRRAQRSARVAERGVWGKCDGNFHSPASMSAAAARRRPCGTIRSTSAYPFTRVVAIRGGALSAGAASRAHLRRSGAIDRVAGAASSPTAISRASLPAGTRRRVVTSGALSMRSRRSVLEYPSGREPQDAGVRAASCVSPGRWRRTGSALAGRGRRWRPPAPWPPPFRRPVPRRRPRRRLRSDRPPGAAPDPA